MLLPLFFACSGPNDETLVDELRVLSMIPAAPEIAPMETTDVDVLVLDPGADGYRALVWTCTRLGDTCLEDDEGRTVSVVEPEAGAKATHFPSPVTASAALAAVASPAPVPFISVWALACVDGACPLLDQVEAGESIDPTVWSDPTDWLADLPIEGTTLAFTTLSISTNLPEDRHQNPILTVEANEESVAPGETNRLIAQLAGEIGSEAKVWGYAADGGFEMTDDRPNLNLRAKLDWVAPADAGETDVWLIAEDGLGGAALWEGSLTAE